MPKTDLDYIFRPVKVNPIELRGYVWKVIKDPTRSREEPGLFYGRLFRMIDIRLSRDEKSTWPDGILFEHVTSGCRLTFDNGVLIDLTNAKIIRKKPRTRRYRAKKDNHTSRTGKLPITGEGI